ncbi:MAG: ABC transporter ATP-binding protein [Alphaproteobacteria bacterium]|nr:ABC transporter ATP-binding protein [Alphaproteobacteria bacterium]
MLRLDAIHTYYGPSHILHGVSLEIAPHRVAAMVGRNGVGKTTTLRSIMGLAAPSGGRVLLEDGDITGWRPHRVARSGVAYVPEGRQIFPFLTVIENIRVAQRRPSRHWSLDRLFALFPRLQERQAHRGQQLSGGEQQMLAIARALASDPRLLLLDEPTQGLAPLVVRELAQVVRSLREAGVTVLLVEQNLGFVEAVADGISVMAKGRIVYNASPERFRADQADIRSRYLTL